MKFTTALGLMVIQTAVLLPRAVVAQGECSVGFEYCCAREILDGVAIGLDCESMPLVFVEGQS